MKENDNREIAFFGKITAGISHEMQNVLAIINESTGLMEDFLNMSGDSSVLNRKKLQDLLVTTQKQIQRGIDIAHQLNRFSHEPDEDIRAIHLSDITGHFVGLAQRFARLQNVALKYSASDFSYKIITRPVLLLMALFAGFECCLHHMPDGGEITLTPLEKAGQPVIHMVCETPDSLPSSFVRALSETEKWGVFQKLVADLGGSAKEDEQTRGIFIHFPEKIQ